MEIGEMVEGVLEGKFQWKSEVPLFLYISLPGILTHYDVMDPGQVYGTLAQFFFAIHKTKLFNSD